MKNIVIIIAICIYCSSCVNERKFTYFRDVPDTIALFNIADTGYKPVIIKPDDLLQINISSPNPEANTFFVSPGTSSSSINGTTTTASANNMANTYLVDKDGVIELPIVGRVNVKGLTTIQVKDEIKNKVLTFLKDPIVTVRLQNFKITVLGEVNRPANYIVPNERVSLLDAIGMAGDLTLYGQRENVLLIRELEGKKVLTRLNLNNSNLFQSPYYYLQQNDIVYVEPNKARVASTDMTRIRNFTIITSLTSLATIIIARLF